jgi:hypothetical protein
MSTTVWELGMSLQVNVVAVAILESTTVSGCPVEALALFVVSPAYEAVNTLLPPVVNAYVSVAVELIEAAVPNTVLPSLKVTLPVGELPATCAVIVTGVLTWTLVADSESVVVVGTFETVRLMPGDVLGVFVPSPSYTAVSDLLPLLPKVYVRFAIPLATAAVPRTVASLLKVTVPVGEPPVTCALRLTGAPTVTGLGEADMLTEVFETTGKLIVLDTLCVFSPSPP